MINIDDTSSDHMIRTLIASQLFGPCLAKVESNPAVPQAGHTQSPTYVPLHDSHYYDFLRSWLL